MSATEARVPWIPYCQLLHGTGHAPAYADARIPQLNTWGYVCKEHFDSLGCQVGTGHGQRLILADVHKDGYQQGFYDASRDNPSRYEEL